MLENSISKKELTSKKSDLNLPTMGSNNSPHRSNIFSGNLGLSQSQSASILQHANIAWGFTKAERFQKIRSNYEFASVLEIPSTLKSKSTSFGYGHKIVMSDVNSKHSKDVPGPDRYSLKSDFDPKHKGRTFGLPHSVYAKVYVPGNNVVNPETAKEIPGPGSYKYDEPIGADKVKYTLKPRGRMFNEGLGGDTPASNYYTPNDVAISPSRFKNTSFGIGGRSDFTKSFGVQNPGPGTYKIKSPFDSYGKQSLQKLYTQSKSPKKSYRKEF
jgi:hypothetical protein